MSLRSKPLGSQVAAFMALMPTTKSFTNWQTAAREGQYDHDQRANGQVALGCQIL